MDGCSPAQACAEQQQWQVAVQGTTRVAIAEDHDQFVLGLAKCAQQWQCAFMAENPPNRLKCHCQESLPPLLAQRADQLGAIVPSHLS